MPIYEYDCQACGIRFEVRIGTSEDRAGLACPDCGSDRLRRRFSAPAVVKKAGTQGPQPGELRPVDSRRYTGSLAEGYAAGTGDKAIREVARQVERGDAPSQVQEFVRGVKQERETTSKKRGTGT